MHPLYLCLVLAVALFDHPDGKTSKAPARADGAPTQVLRFGVYTSDRATEMYKSFTPLIEALGAYLTQELAQPIDVELVIERTYEAAQDDLCSGRVDIARFGPASYVVAKQRTPGISIIAVEEVGEQKNFNGIVFVRGDSTIEKLSDLKGKTFAFGDRSSTLGRYLPQVELVRAGIRAKDLKSVSYLDRHDKVVTAVLNGDYDAGSAKEGTFKKYQDRPPGLRALVMLSNVTKPWLAREGLSPQLAAATRKFLLACRDKQLLTPLDDATGFQAGDDHDFDRIREAMKLSEEFEH